jgi:hypothetical protein
MAAPTAQPVQAAAATLHFPASARFPTSSGLGGQVVGEGSDAWHPPVIESTV